MCIAIDSFLGLRICQWLNISRLGRTTTVWLKSQCSHSQCQTRSCSAAFGKWWLAKIISQSAEKKYLEYVSNSNYLALNRFRYIVGNRHESLSSPSSSSSSLSEKNSISNCIQENFHQLPSFGPVIRGTRERQGTETSFSIEIEIEEYLATQPFDAVVNGVPKEFWRLSHVRCCIMVRWERDSVLFTSSSPPQGH